MLSQQWCLSTTEKEQPLHALGAGFVPEETRPENEKSTQVAPSYPRAWNLHLASSCGHESPALQGASGDGRALEQGHEAGADTGKRCGSTSGWAVPRTDTSCWSPQTRIARLEKPRWSLSCLLLHRDKTNTPKDKLSAFLSLCIEAHCWDWAFSVAHNFLQQQSPGSITASLTITGFHIPDPQLLSIYLDLGKK